ncbi:MAG: efflux RND transporter periplasmic adaptor subunit [Candidatus Eisenbacteria bacterium]|nr:efflux RND transporter periplasmic adaptor subunit [Candidatus Eisenbacteria bacterium]
MRSEPSRSSSADLERLRIRDETRRRKKRRGRWLLAGVGVVVLLALLVMLARPAKVAVVPVRAGGNTPADAGGAVLTANGYVEARHQASVAARTTGRLAAVLVEEGDRVDSGQVVARLIDDDPRALVAEGDANFALAEARLEQARAAETEAERQRARREALLAEGLLSDEEAEGAATAAILARADRAAAEAAVGVARAALATARLELDKTRITAPFDGVVLRKDAEVGEIVGPIMTSNTARAGAVVTIADLHTLEAGVDCNEAYIARLSLGQPADIVLDAYPEVHFPGEVRAIYPSADRDKATIPVRVRFLALDDRIRPDLGVKVTFLERRPTEEIVVVKKTLAIPATAVRERNGGSFVWIVREGKLESVGVSVGEKLEDGTVAVLSGLNEGDQVVAEPAPRTRKGMRAQPVAR